MNKGEASGQKKLKRNWREHTEEGMAGNEGKQESSGLINSWCSEDVSLLQPRASISQEQMLHMVSRALQVVGVQNEGI